MSSTLRWIKSWLRNRLRGNTVEILLKLSNLDIQLTSGVINFIVRDFITDPGRAKAQNVFLIQNHFVNSGEFQPIFEFLGTPCREIPRSWKKYEKFLGKPLSGLKNLCKNHQSILKNCWGISENLLGSPRRHHQHSLFAPWDFWGTLGNFKGIFQLIFRNPPEIF